MNRREKQLQKDIEYFLEEKRDPFSTYNINWFKRIFEPFLFKNDNYLLDGLSRDQREIFWNYYIGWCNGGGTYDFGWDLPRKYRNEFRIFGSFILMETSKE